MNFKVSLTGNRTLRSTPLTPLMATYQVGHNRYPISHPSFNLTITLMLLKRWPL